MSRTTTMAGARIQPAERVSFLELAGDGIHTVTMLAAGPAVRTVGDLWEFATLDSDGNMSGMCQLRGNQLVTIHEPGETLR